jgi:hypothetical protein
MDRRKTVKEELAESIVKQMGLMVCPKTGKTWASAEHKWCPACYPEKNADIISKI